MVGQVFVWSGYRHSWRSYPAAKRRGDAEHPPITSVDRALDPPVIVAVAAGLRTRTAASFRSSRAGNAVPGPAQGSGLSRYSVNSIAAAVECPELEPGRITKRPPGAEACSGKGRKAAVQGALVSRRRRTSEGFLTDNRGSGLRCEDLAEQRHRHSAGGISRFVSRMASLATSMPDPRPLAWVVWECAGPRAAALVTMFGTGNASHACGAFGPVPQGCRSGTGFASIPGGDNAGVGGRPERRAADRHVAGSSTGDR
jgi:hypothetical protein